MSNLTDAFKRTAIYQEMIAEGKQEVLVVNNGITDFKKIRNSPEYLCRLRESLGDKQFNHYMKGEK